MLRTKEEYESKINNSPLWNMTKHEREESKSERFKLMNYIGVYLSRYIMNKENFNKYGLEIATCIKGCTKAFVSSSGVFLHYFNKALKNEKARLDIKEHREKMRMSIKISDDAERKLRQIIKFVESKNINCNDIDVQSKIASFMNLSIEKTRMLIDINNIKCVDNTIVTKMSLVVYLTV